MADSLSSAGWAGGVGGRYSSTLSRRGGRFGWASELGEGNVARIRRRYLFAMCARIASQCSEIVLLKYPTAGACDFGVSPE